MDTNLFSATPVSSLLLLRTLVFLHLSQVVGGQLVFSVSRGSTRPVRLRLDQVQVADGQWHDLQLELRDVRSGRETRYVATLRLDFGLYQVMRVMQTSKKKKENLKEDVLHKYITRSSSLLFLINKP